MRLIGSVRVSTDEQKKHGVSPEAQESIIRAYCLAHGHDLVDLFFDLGESASTMQRPGLLRILGMLDRGEIDGVIVAKLDRLTRNVADFAWLLDTYFSKKKPFHLISCAEVIETRTASGRLVLFILMSASQWELEIGYERTEAALEYKQSHGERTGSVPFGFDLDENGPRNKKGKPIQLVENDDEQRTIEMIKGLDASGYSTRAIATRLTDLRIPTKTGNAPWRHQTVAKILERKPKREIPDAPETETDPST